MNNIDIRSAELLNKTITCLHKGTVPNLSSCGECYVLEHSFVVW